MSKIRMASMFSMMLSFCKCDSISKADMAHIQDCLNNYNASFPRQCRIYKECKVIDEEFNTSQDFLQKVISTENIYGVTISFDVQFVFSFGSCYAAIDIRRHSAGDYFSMRFCQTDFMDNLDKFYLEDRMNELSELATLIFRDGSYVAGLIDVEESVGPIDYDYFIQNPPINWVFWNKSILNLLPDEVMSSIARLAKEVKTFDDGSQFWQWTTYGNGLEKDQLSAAGELRKELSAAIRKLPSLPPPKMPPE